MKLLDRYVLRRGLVTLVLLCATVALLISSIDLLVRFSQLMRGDLLAGQSRWGLIATRYLTQIPFLLKAFLPLLMAAAAVITLMPMLRHRQLMLLAASGIGGRRVGAGLVALAVVVGLIDAVNRDLVLPVTEPLRTESEDMLLGNHASTASWRMPDSGTVWFAGHLERRAEMLRLHRVVAFATDGAMLYCQQIELEAQGWRGHPPLRLVDAADRLQRLEVLPSGAAFELPASAEDLAALTTPRRDWFGPRLLAHGEAAGRAIVYSRWIFLLAAPAACMMAVLVFARPANRDRLTAATVQALLVAALPVLACSLVDELLLVGSRQPELSAVVAVMIVGLPTVLIWRRSAV